jgi:hypothetical protein
MTLEAAQIAELIAEPKWRVLEAEGGGVLSQEWFERFVTDIRREDLDGVMAVLLARTDVVDPCKGTQWERTGTWTVGQHRMTWTDDARQTLRVWETLWKGTAPPARTTSSEAGLKVTTSWVLGVRTLPLLDPALDGVWYRYATVSQNPQTGLWTATVEKLEEIDQAGEMREVNADGVTTEVTHSALPSGSPSLLVPGDTSAGIGVTRRVTHRPTRGGRTEQSVVVNTESAQRLDLTYPTPYGSAVLKVRRQVQPGEFIAEAAGLSSDASNDVGASLSPGGLVNGTISSRPRAPDSIIDNNNYFASGQIGPLASYVNGALKIVYVFIQYSGGSATAYAHCNASPVMGSRYQVVGSAAGHVTTVNPIRGGRIKEAIRVEREI